jgi:hypothetical protein
LHLELHFALLSRSQLIAFTPNFFSDDDYKRKLGERFFDASVGGHIRHSCDHFQNLVNAHDHYSKATTPPLILTTFSYDERSRETKVQSERGEALKVIDRMVLVVPSLVLDTDILIGFLAAETNPMETFSVESTVARELTFVAHHGIHHLATISLMMDHMNYKLESSSCIGKAPSTVQFESRRAKVLSGEELEAEWVVDPHEPFPK